MIELLPDPSREVTSPRGNLGAGEPLESEQHNLAEVVQAPPDGPHPVGDLLVVEALRRQFLGSLQTLSLVQLDERPTPSVEGVEVFGPRCLLDQARAERGDGQEAPEVVAAVFPAEAPIPGAVVERPRGDALRITNRQGGLGEQAEEP